MDFSPREIQLRFLKRFKREPLVIRSPGRINLIGEHTDYNNGFVMPAAIDRETYFGVSPSEDQRTLLYSVKYQEEFEVNFDNLQPVSKPAWANYLLGVLHQFRERGFRVQPFYCAFGGNIPLGAGLSSSAALECGFAFALSELNQLNVSRLDIVSIAQWAEHHYAGVKCGIMDQFASVMGKAENVILLDCQSLQHRYLPLDLKGHNIVLCDSRVKHALVDSEYNTRRMECEAGVQLLRQYYPEVHSLRDVSHAMLEEHGREMEGKVYQRCRYVVDEILRVQQASADLERGDLAAFGQKMYETHDGLSRMYQVSCPELDFLVKEARSFEGVIGARMMGGGFGGCTINLVRADRTAGFVREIAARYERSFDILPDAYEVKVVDGTGRVSERKRSA